MTKLNRIYRDEKFIEWAFGKEAWSELLAGNLHTDYLMCEWNERHADKHTIDIFYDYLTTIKKLYQIYNQWDKMDKQIKKVKKDIKKGDKAKGKKDVDKLLKMDKKADKEMSACRKK